MKNCGIYHLFKTPFKKYVYDANKNALLSISDALCFYLDGQTDLSPEIESEINHLKEQSYLLEE